MKNKKFLVAVLATLAIIDVVVFSQLGDWWTPPRELPVNNSSEVVDSTWGTYINEGRGFSLKYPPVFVDVVRVKDPTSVDSFHVDSINKYSNSAHGEESLSVDVIQGPLSEFIFNPGSGGGEAYSYNEKTEKWWVVGCPDCPEDLLYGAPKPYTTRNSYTAYFLESNHVCAEFEKGLVESPTKDFVIEIIVSRPRQILDCGNKNPLPVTNTKTILLVLDTLQFDSF